jgi:hypothetical protein
MSFSTVVDKVIFILGVKVGLSHINTLLTVYEYWNLFVINKYLSQYTLHKNQHVLKLMSYLENSFRK